MKTKRWIWAAALLSLVAHVWAAPAWGAPPAGELLRRAKGALEPARPSLRSLRIRVGAGANAVEWKAAEARKPVDGGGSAALLVLLEPAEVAGTALLFRQGKTGSPTQWVYLPAVHRGRELRGATAFEHFLGTDFTYGDLGLMPVERRSATLLGEEDLDGVPAYKVEEVPERYAPYSRIVTWIAARTMLPRRREFFDRAGELWKRESFQEVSEIDGVPTPMRIRMEDVQAGTASEVRVEALRYDVTLADALFDPDRLSGVAASSVWRELYGKAAR